MLREGEDEVVFPFTIEDKVVTELVMDHNSGVIEVVMATPLGGHRAGIMKHNIRTLELIMGTSRRSQSW